MVRPFQHEPLLAGKGQLSILTRAGRAVGADQGIADHTAKRRWRDGGCYEMVSSTGQKRHFVAAIPEKLVPIAVAPVLVAARAEAQLLHAAATCVEQARDRPGFGQPRQCSGRDVDGFFQVRTQMGRTQAHHMAHRGGPRMMLPCTVITCATHHQAAH